jgi:hypothetical protein
MALIRNSPSDELKTLVHKLGGSWAGDSAMCRCPAHADRTPSLSIRQGDRGILVTCHAGCDRSIVLREISRIIQIPNFRPQSVKAAPARTGKPHLAIWRAAAPIEGTLAETYIRTTRQIQRPLCDVRFHPRCPRGAGLTAKFEPALIVGMRKRDEIAAIQRIFLDPVTADQTAKIVLGIAIGAAWTNGTPAATIGIAEGFETAAAYTELTGIQAWSTMGAKRLHQLTFPPNVKTVILLADNDPEGRAAAARAREAYAEGDVVLRTEWPPDGANDWAQLLKR